MQDTETADQKFDRLVEQLHVIRQTTAGTGARGQHYIDAAYAELVKFTQEHPTYAARLPPRPRSHDDGAMGFGSGLPQGGVYWRRW